MMRKHVTCYKSYQSIKAGFCHGILAASSKFYVNFMQILTRTVLWTFISFINNNNNQDSNTTWRHSSTCFSGPLHTSHNYWASLLDSKKCWWSESFISADDSLLFFIELVRTFQRKQKDGRTPDLPDEHNTFKILLFILIILLVKEKF